MKLGSLVKISVIVFGLFLLGFFDSALAMIPPPASIAKFFPAPRERNVFLQKKLFLFNNDNSTTGDEQATFEPGDWVAVRLKLNRNLADYTSIKLVDFFPKDAIGIAEITMAQCGIAGSTRASAAFPTPAVLSHSLTWNSVPIPQSDVFICYKFQVPDAVDEKDKAKNRLVQVRATAYRTIFGFEKSAETTANFMMVRGFPFQALNYSGTTNFGASPPIFEINDFTSVINTVGAISLTGQYVGNSVSYIYSKGAGYHSRGGSILFLPVTMTNKTGANTLAYDSSHLFYNPAYYLFGNIFSSGGIKEKSLDIGSGASGSGVTVSGEDYASQEDLNSKAAFYNYQIDKNSVTFWNSNLLDKNRVMQNKITGLISQPRPDVTCAFDDFDSDPDNNTSFVRSRLAAVSGNFYLDNDNCQPAGTLASGRWPSGRVWYIKPNADITIKTAFQGKGTLIIDFAGITGRVPKVILETNLSDFSSGSMLGLMVINGGQVEISKTATYFRGIIFVPGKPAPNPGGEVIFVEDPLASAVEVHGSIVANKITFGRRNRGTKLYAVAIFNDAKVLNSPPIGFENIAGIVY
ncbi:MAG: hypothetical protein OEV37_01075 [Candidatus Berkelbacteria bacterium]|nr:hypothetical protein [Candidatus Berkelbacteria bacterium]